MASWGERWLTARRWWAEDTPRPVRWTVYICVPLGTALLTAGAYGDSQQWWEGRSFVTNLVSSFTSLLFGIPTALIVLSHLSLAQAEAAQRKAVRNRARRAAQEFRAAVMGRLIANDDRDAQSKISDALNANMNLDACIPKTTLPGQVLSASDYRSLRDKASERQRRMEQVLRNPHGYAGGWLNEIVLRWTSLDRDVRPRLEEIGLPWIPPLTDREVRGAIKAIEEHNSGHCFLDLSHEDTWRGQVTDWGTVHQRFGTEINDTRQLLRALRRITLWLGEIDRLGV